MRQVGVIMQADELKATTSDGAAIVDACKGEKINPSSSNPTKKANHAMGSVIAICFGACAGALARWQLGLWLSAGSLIPWGTLAANLIGGYLVGVCVATFQAMPQIDAVWRLLLVTGFLGALTTFSTFSAEVIALLQQGRYALALGTASLHLFGSLLLTLAGIKTAIFLIAAYAR